MALIVLKSIKGSPLTQAEVDANWDNINDELVAHILGADPHPQYLTQTEGDARYPLSGFTTISGNTGSAVSETVSDTISITGTNGITTTASDVGDTLTITPTYATPNTIQPDATASEGVANSFARSDHRHAIDTAVAVALGASALEGTSTSFSRADHVHPFFRLDQAVAPTASVSLNNQKITSLATPTADSDAATKAYVDALKQGLDVKDSVRVATTANITLSGLQTIDDISLVAGDRVLVKNQTLSENNGIYVVSATAWSRSTDADTSAKVTGGLFTFITNGTTNGDSGWILISNDPITLGTTPISFSQFSGAGQITAGDGLTKTGNTLNAVGTTNRITVNADSIDIASTYVGQTSITTLGTITTGIWNGSTIAVAHGGTGVTTSTGSGSNVLSTSPVLTTPNLGTPSAVTLTNATGLPIVAGTTGTLSVARGGTGATTLSGLVKGNGTSAFTEAIADTDYLAPASIGVSVQGYDVNTAKLNVAQSFTAQQTFKEVKDTVFTITDAAGFQIDPANGSIQTITLGANRTPSATNFEAGQIVLLGIDDGTAFTITWSTVAVTWVKSGGAASSPTLATTGFTWILLWKVGSVVYGLEVGKE